MDGHSRILRFFSGALTSTFAPNPLPGQGTYDPQASSNDTSGRLPDGAPAAVTGCGDRSYVAAHATALTRLAVTDISSGKPGDYCSDEPVGQTGAARKPGPEIG